MEETHLLRKSVRSIVVQPICLGVEGLVAVAAVLVQNASEFDTMAAIRQQA